MDGFRCIIFVIIGMHWWKLVKYSNCIHSRSRKRKLSNLCIISSTYLFVLKLHVFVTYQIIQRGTVCGDAWLPCWKWDSRSKISERRRLELRAWHRTEPLEKRGSDEEVAPNRWKKPSQKRPRVRFIGHQGVRFNDVRRLGIQGEKKK